MKTTLSLFTALVLGLSINAFAKCPFTAGKASCGKAAETKKEAVVAKCKEGCVKACCDQKAKCTAEAAAKCKKGCDKECCGAKKAAKCAACPDKTTCKKAGKCPLNSEAAATTTCKEGCKCAKCTTKKACQKAEAAAETPQGKCCGSAKK